MRWLALTALLASPALADQPMTLSACETGWNAMSERLLPSDLPRTSGHDRESDDEDWLDVRLTTDGWCRMIGSDGGVSREFDWQAEGIAAFVTDGTPPLALHLRGQNISNTLNYQVAFRRVPGTGQLLVENVTLTTANGAPVLRGTALFTGAFFDSSASLASSLGGVTVSQVATRITLDPGAMDQTAGRELVGDVLDGLDDAQLPPDSRAALRNLMVALPAARGVVDINATSERGLGWIQIAVVNGFSPDASRAEKFGFGLSGVVLTADWRPD